MKKSFKKIELKKVIMMKFISNIFYTYVTIYHIKDLKIINL